MAVSTQKTLVGWKAIAGYFSRDERTVMRWAASRGMPVQRVAGQARSSVYAWPDDLDAWLGRSSVSPIVAEAEPAPAAIASPRTRRRLMLPAVRPNVIITILAVLCAIFIAIGALAAFARPNRIDPPLPGASIPAFRDPQARAAYLQATFDWNLRTRESLHRAIAEFGDAVAREPGVAASYVGLANSYLLLREHAAMPDDEAYARAAAAARIAIGLDPRSMEARRALAFIDFWWRGDVVTAGREFAEAIAIAPNDALTHHWLATALSANGEQSAALREISTSRALDPTASATLIDYGLIAYVAGHRAYGARVLHALREVDPDNAALHRTLGDIALFEGRHRDYVAEAARAAELRGDAAATAILARRAADLAHGGAPLMFENMVDAARDHSRRTNDDFFELARVAAISGRTVAAIDALAPACNAHEQGAIGAPGDLWLSRAVEAATVRRLCGRPSLDTAVGRVTPA